MLSMNERLAPDRDVVDTRLGEEVALLHLESRTYYSLNASGARIWSGIKAGHTLGTICDGLQQAYAVDARRAERSVSELAQALLEQGLVRRERSAD